MKKATTQVFLFTGGGFSFFHRGFLASFSPFFCVQDMCRWKIMHIGRIQTSSWIFFFLKLFPVKLIINDSIQLGATRKAGSRGQSGTLLPAPPTSTQKPKPRKFQKDVTRIKNTSLAPESPGDKRHLQCQVLPSTVIFPTLLHSSKLSVILLQKINIRLSETHFFIHITAKCLFTLKKRKKILSLCRFERNKVTSVKQNQK